MNTETLQLAKEMLNELAAKLGTTAEMIYPYLLQQITVEIVQKIVLLCLSVAVLIIGCKLVQTGRKINKENTDEDDPGFTHNLGGGILVTAGLLLSINLVNTLIQLTMNPNFYIFAEMIPNLLK